MRTAGGGPGAFPGSAWLAALRARGTDPAFAAARAALDARVDGYHRVLPDLPTRQAGYYHDFFCPQHAVQLVFDPRGPHRHVCPVDGTVFSGEPFDSAWGWSVNDALSDAALRSAVRFAMGGGDGARRGLDLALARRILLGYADRYRTMTPAPKPYPGPYAGIACWSALDEDVWIIRMAWAAALLGDALPAADHDAIRTGLLEPGRDHLARVRYSQIQNVANWDNSALLTLALALGDEPAVADILDGEWGVADEVARGVGVDGLWWEVSLSYHYYVLAALSWTIRALRATGRPFGQESTVREMFRAPLDLAFADGTLPAIHDCWYHIGLTGEVGHGIPSAEGFHELAWGWFDEPAFGQVLAANTSLRSRGTLEALLDGASAAPPSADRPTGARPSRHFADAGVAVLRSPAPADVAVILRAGSDGDAHGHPDQLGIQLYGLGGRIAIDPGTPGYGIALNDTWYRQTGSHSTVLIDSASQPPTAGRITRFDERTVEAEVAWPSAAEWPAVVERAASTWWPQVPSGAYAEVRMARRVALTDDGLEDDFDVEAPAERTIDWLLHVRGEFEGQTEPAPGALDGPCGYDQLEDVRRVTSGAPLRFRLPNGHLTLAFDPEPGELQFVASAPGNPAADRHTLFVRRQTGRRARFATRIDLEEGRE